MNFSEDRLIVSTGQARSTNPSEKGTDSLPIPLDLVIDIFSRLPAKSVVRCRCLSKFWANLIRSKLFIDLFAARSSSRPQMLFGFENNHHISFFSVDESSLNSSDNIAWTQPPHTPLSGTVCAAVNGLACICEFFHDRMWEVTIYNFTTGESLTLPEMMRYNPSFDMRNISFGYDPTKQHFKVIVLTYALVGSTDEDCRYVVQECQVLTVETEQMSWRKIECSQSHHPIGGDICINGVLYSKALYESGEDRNASMIACLDVGTETFWFIDAMETFNKKLPESSVLANYCGNLCLLIPEESNPCITGESVSFELWVLKDAEKLEWSKHVYVLPPVWKNIVGESELIFHGMIGTDEIVLSFSESYYPSGRLPLYLFCYNIEKNTIRRLNIDGIPMEAAGSELVCMCLNHVENICLLNQASN